MHATALVLIAVIGLVYSVPNSPKWADSYQASGTLSLPYAELDEPFTVYYDGKLNRSRADFYDGLTQTYQMRSVAGLKGGATFKIAFMTTNTDWNVRSCFQTNGSTDDPVMPQSMLPDLKNFTKTVDATMYKNVNVSVWTMVEMKGTKKNKYTMFVANDKGNTPIRYEMYGYDSLLGSHYDKYYIDYTHYTAGPIDSKVFVIKNLTCGGFPGPGDAEQVALSSPLKEYIGGSDEHHKELFTKFKKTHSKQYKDDREHAERETIFRQNVRFIHSKNRAGLTYRLAINHMADRSTEELRLMNGRRSSIGLYNGGKPFDASQYKDSDIPDTKDWRIDGAVNPVKDQAVCGSCWSFGTTGTIEGAYFLKYGRRIRFSQQELMDCSWGYGNNGCDGGEDFRAYQWIQNNGGLASEDDYGAYMAVDGKCHSNSTKNSVQIDEYFNVTVGDEMALKKSIAMHGPVSVAIDASHLSLSFYADGVYYEKDCSSTDLDHAVLAVGYGTYEGQSYWLVKNSWSTYWGNSGYVLMSTKDNNCGVASDATFVSVK